MQLNGAEDGVESVDFRADVGLDFPSFFNWRKRYYSFFALNLSELGLVLCGTVVANSPSTKHLFSACGSPL